MARLRCPSRSFPSRASSLAYERAGTRNVILADLDLDVARGEFLVIVGESGVGKSTSCAC